MRFVSRFTVSPPPISTFLGGFGFVFLFGCVGVLLLCLLFVSTTSRSTQ